MGATPAADDAAAGSGQAGATGPLSQGVTDDEILIGGSGPLSGVTGFLGEEVFGAIDSYFQLVNSRGGINGRKLRLISYDDRFDSSQTLAKTRRLWEQDKVAAVFLVFGDPVADYVTRNRIPAVVFGVTPKSFSSKYPTIFPSSGTPSFGPKRPFAASRSKACSREGMRVGMMYDTQILDVGPYVPFLKAAWEDTGAGVVSADTGTSKDWAGSCARRPPSDSSIGHQLDGAIGNQRRRARDPGRSVGRWHLGGSQGDRPTGAPRERTAAHDEYVNAIKRYHPEIASFSHYDSPATIGCWSGAQLLVAALEAQGPNITKEGVLDWIAKVENFDTGIMPPIISMTPNCKTGSEVVWIGQWKWDSAKKEAVRTPATGYFTSDQKEKYGGKCFLTKVSDQLG